MSISEGVTLRAVSRDVGRASDAIRRRIHVATSARHTLCGQVITPAWREEGPYTGPVDDQCGSCRWLIEQRASHEEERTP